MVKDKPESEVHKKIKIYKETQAHSHKTINIKWLLCLLPVPAITRLLAGICTTKRDDQ